MAKPMRSFRLKTVLLTVILSSALLASTGVIGWRLLHKEFQDTLDAKILLPGQRITEYHGWKSDWKHFETTIDTLIGQDWKKDRILKVRSNMYKRGTVYKSDNWPENFPQEDIPRFEALQDRVHMVEQGDNPGLIRYSLLDAPHLYTVSAGNSHWRMATLANPELSLYIGINLDSFHANIRKLRTFYFGALIIVVIAIGVGAYWIANRALKPVNAIAQTAKSTTSKELSQRISPSDQFDQEFDSLIAVINEMMERLEKSFRQTMRFSSDASHELKTPLAIIQSEISTRLQKCEPESIEQQTLTRLLEEVERLKRIIRSLFLLSQADAGKMPLTLETYDFSEQLEAFTNDAKILSEDIGLSIEATIEPGLHVHADHLMLGQVIQNLISNAIKHNEVGGFVKWQLRSQNGQLSFTIENSGTPIPVEDRPHIFDRFYRGRQKRSGNAPGLGLGLSLAREIALAHHGNLALVHTNATSTRFDLTLAQKSSPRV